VKQCSVLYITGADCTTPYGRHLRQFGLRVHEHHDWPDAEQTFLDSEVLVIHVTAATAPGVAMRVRAKPRFGRRVLVALVPEETSLPDRRAALGAGFDDVLSDTTPCRTLVARLLRALRHRPEYRCYLPRTAA
jgi:DNA-binding response OmpR family regulator